MALPLIAAGAALVPEVFRFFQGQSQIRKANAINPVMPQFQANQGILNNNRILQERSTNYQIPGYGQAVNNINSSTAQAFANGVQGATSGGDVLDLATKLQYGQQQGFNQLSQQNIQGADMALNQYLDSNVMAGNEAVRKNMFDLDNYNRQLEEKAALLQAGSQNRYGAIDNTANALRYFTQPQQQITQQGTSGQITPYGSIYK